MKKIFQNMFLGLSLISAPAFAVDGQDLEPCINGDVSSTGTFVNQDAEDRHYEGLRQAEALQLEPCINGDVSASGNFASQAAEDNYLGLIVPEAKSAQVTVTEGGFGE